MDGESVDASSYTAEAGSVIIKLKPEFMETLGVDKHVLTAQFDDGSATADFAVVSGGSTDKKTGKSSSAPKTGDIPMAPLLAIMVLAAIAAILSRFFHHNANGRRETSRPPT